MSNNTIDDLDKTWSVINDYAPLEDSQEYKAFVSRSEKPLAELREKMLLEVALIKEDIHKHYSCGVAIGISPTDTVLQKYDRGEITKSIESIFKRASNRRPGAPESRGRFDAILVGEYSPQFRWHYHGILIVENVLILEKVKRILNKLIGRTIVEQINNVPRYVEYMFKQYDNTTYGTYYPWNVMECIVRYNYLPNCVKLKRVAQSEGQGNTPIHSESKKWKF